LIKTKKTLIVRILKREWPKEQRYKGNKLMEMIKAICF